MAFGAQPTDTEIFLDNTLLISIDHSTDFNYKITRGNYSPNSKIIFCSKGFEIIGALEDLCDRTEEKTSENKHKCKIQIGLQAYSQVQISKKQYRTCMGNKADVPSLIEQIKHPSEHKKAIEILGVIGDKSAIPSLLETRTDKNTYVQAMSAQALGEIGDRSVLPAVEDAHQHYTNQSSYGWMFEQAIDTLQKSPPP